MEFVVVLVVLLVIGVVLLVRLPRGRRRAPGGADPTVTDRPPGRD